MKKIFVGVFLCVLFIANCAAAEQFFAPVKIGEIGAPVQSPYHGFVVEGATTNDGKPIAEEMTYNRKKISTFMHGTAKFGELRCKYDFDGGEIRFGNAEKLFLTLDGSLKEIFRIDGDKRTLYAIYHNYCVTDLKILDNRGVLIDTKKFSGKFFGGKDGYKFDGGVLYDVPMCTGDTLVVRYRRWHWGGESAPEGELRFKWNEAAQSFRVTQIVY